MRLRPGALALILLVGLPAPTAGVGTVAQSSCLACHGDVELFGEPELARVREFRGDVHAEVALSCHDCHGGNPDPALSEDPEAAMDPRFAANPFRAAPERIDIPTFCGRCHSDPAIMRRFRPDARVDQEREYRISQHGLALARGDAEVAICSDCHGSHGIRRVDDPLAPVHPTRVAETCRGCHADAVKMSARRLPVDQYSRWRQSVHARALLEKEDLSAPTCNDCHGNHGAAPPGLDSIAFVCGQCHPREAELFRSSPKAEGFVRHNEYLAEVGAEGCAGCHDDLPLRPEIQQRRSFPECSTCHGHHGVVAPTTALLSPLPGFPCFTCHEGPRAQELEEPEAVQRHYSQVRDDLLGAARQLGLEGDERYDWLVDQARRLPAHTFAGAEGEPPRRRPEFGRLFDKFRIGKTHYDYTDPATGETQRGRLVRCDDCHVSREPASGLRVGAQLVGRMQELSALTASAERILLRARRGGVETRGVFAEVDAAVGAEIQLEALVHGFQAEGGEFAARHAEGVAHARAAVVAGRQALGELAARRKGLAVSLVVIGALLLALALRIRSTDERDGPER